MYYVHPQNVFVFIPESVEQLRIMNEKQKTSVTLQKPTLLSRDENEAATQRFFLVNIWWEINVPTVTYSHIRLEKRRDSLQIQAGVTFRSSTTTPMNITTKNFCESNKIHVRKKE